MVGVGRRRRSTAEPEYDNGICSERAGDRGGLRGSGKPSPAIVRTRFTPETWADQGGWGRRVGRKPGGEEGDMERMSSSIFPPKLRVRHCAGNRPSSSCSAKILPINHLDSGTSLPNDAGMDGSRRELKDWSHGSRNHTFPQCKGGMIQGAAAAIRDHAEDTGESKQEPWRFS